MNNDLEYNFLQNQLDNNRQIRGLIENEITSLMAFIHQKRDWLKQLEDNDRQLKHRLHAIGDKNKTLIKYNNEYEKRSNFK